MLSFSIVIYIINSISIKLTFKVCFNSKCCWCGSIISGNILTWFVLFACHYIICSEINSLNSRVITFIFSIIVSIYSYLSIRLEIIWVFLRRSFVNYWILTIIFNGKTCYLRCSRININNIFLCWRHAAVIYNRYLNFVFTVF